MPSLKGLESRKSREVLLQVGSEVLELYICHMQLHIGHDLGKLFKEGHSSFHLIGGGFTV